MVSLYEQYANEAVFREEFVKPLLNRMGFFGVEEKHGQNEFGKDFVFSELTRFGFEKHYAAQVKHERAISQSRKAKVGELLIQIKEAFAVPFRLADDATERHVSAVYVFNSGDITDGAQEYVLQSLRKEHYGDNVYFFSGDRLDSLNRWIVYGNNENVRSRLLGLLNHLGLNVIIWKAIIQNAAEDTIVDSPGMLLSGIESFLAAPICQEYISDEEVAEIWQKARAVDAVCKSSTARFGLRGPAKTDAIASLKSNINDLLRHSDNVTTGIQRALNALRPL